MEPATAGVFHAAENLFSGAAALVKGITNPTLPLTALLTHITSVPLPRTQHTISVVKGRAYIFGGETAPGHLADNDMHIVILPSSGVLEADYQAVKARPEQAGGEVPKSRKSHTSVVIGDSIYIFGGEGVENENGRVWVYHTVRNTWFYLDPAPENLFPAHRAGHAAASSEFPGPKDITYTEKAPQQPADPAKVVPEPADSDTWGTIFIVGGRNTQTGELLTDALAFDVRSRTWSNIPTPAGPALEGASITLVGNELYHYGGKTSDTPSTANGTLQHLDVSPVWKHAEGGTTPLTSGWSWEETPHIAKPTSPPSTGTTTSTPIHPAPRFSAPLTPLTTGQGRHYLLLTAGSSPAPSSTTTLLDDIWAFQLPAERATAAATKDSLRHSLRQETREGKWSEVRYKYVDGNGDEEVGEHVGHGKKGVGARTGFAVARGTEVDGASAVVWGGVDADGRVLGDGWLVSVDR
ncbi:hypothetical protein K458DRAFT_185337 [Lentithecium fluviatile CBS 122367]|uniref:Galactose oxidase n=1 Tax=Lentithecium fluviatile CBS 122367 TaxID=1168545 RepID=A0A6G1J972_9PLEO|nr:hypothetical protein K458DRAFT_185337 [Lentithecium fluviatile CBS 122367]